VPADVARRALRKLEAVDAAHQVSDLKVPPGNRLHALKGDRAGQHAISVNDQWRICFRFTDGDAYDVEFCDYH
jgi:proteic killer suppression protein